MNTDAVSVVRAYHRAWTSKEFDADAALLADELVVEVPINDYPTKASFADAVAGFGRLVISVEMLSELSEGGEAVQLYDIEVNGLGPMRIAEHFTVRDGKIV